MSEPRPLYQRAIQPRPMLLTKRDKHILETIHAFDGLLSLKQIDRLFFSGHGRSQPRARMRLLFDHGYVNMPNPRTIHRVPLGETVFWLGHNGAAVVAGLQGKSLRRFPWRSQPRYSLVKHDLAVNDVHIAITQACQQDINLNLKRWVPESELFAYPDTVEVPQRRGKSQKRQVRPDGFFVLQHRQKPHPFAFLLEVDMATKDNPRFVREKVAPGKVYLKSDLFQKRFGLRYGRYLIVTTGERRLKHMKKAAEIAGGQGLFYFTTLAAVRAESILNETIWWLAGKDKRQFIIPELSLGRIFPEN